jgi:putative tryptophan/tyrosine transport system substrate-binding protein
MRRRELITLLGGATLTWPLAASAQQRATPVIGFVLAGSPDSYTHLTAAFRRGLGETGYFDGQTVVIEYHWTENQSDRVPALAADLVGRSVAVIAVTTTAAAHAIKAATAAIPIVFGVGDDPVRTGLVASFNRPGGNVTGVNFLASNLGPKRLNLLRELLPGAVRVAVLINRSVFLTGIIGQDSSIDVAVQKDVEAGAPKIGLAIDILHAGNIREIDAIFPTLVQKRADALLISPDPLFTAQRAQIASLAARHAIPTIYPQREYPEVGGLISYGTSLADAYRQMGIYTGRILKGEKPGDLPVAQPTRFELVINMRAARSLGLPIPPKLFALADEVIE